VPFISFGAEELPSFWPVQAQADALCAAAVHSAEVPVWALHAVMNGEVY